jgi:hypothetical protein
MIVQVERALNFWATGHYVVSNHRPDNNFSSDLWSKRTEILIRAAQKLSVSAWGLIYADVQKVLTKKTLVIDSSDDGIDPVDMLCSDIDFMSSPFKCVSFSVFSIHSHVSLYL